MKINLFVFMLVPWAAMATNFKVADKNVHASPELGKIKLYHHDKQGFKVWRDGKMEKVGPENLSSELRSMNNKTLKEYQKHAFMRVSKDSEGKVNVDSTVRGTAGGPILGETCYWAVHAGAMWAIGIATQAIVGNTKATKVAGAQLSPAGDHPVVELKEKGGVPGLIAHGVEQMATNGAKLCGGLYGIEATKALGFMTKAAIDNFNAPLTAKGSLVGYHAPTYQSPFLASQMSKATPMVTPKQVAAWGISAGAGHKAYLEGYAGSAGRAEWSIGTAKFMDSLNPGISLVKDGALNGVTLGLGVAATQGTTRIGTLGGIEFMAQAARAWGYAQLWCP